MSNPPADDHGFWRSPAGLALGIFLVAGAVLLVAEHGAHLFGAWPVLLLVACAGMHLFMHSGHGGHSEHKGDHNER